MAGGAASRRVQVVGVDTPASGPTAAGYVWGISAPMRELRERVAAVAPTASGVLLVGETGTGKGALARVLHATSPRRDAPFVQFDCAGVAPSLIESALFGHERGAFTGAEARRVGRAEAAAGGTLFLDEVAELERTVQSRLLRLLQDRAYERVGGGATLRLGARVVAATNRDLAEAVAGGAFREDLLHRLAVVALRVPALRERRADIPLLLERAAAHAARRTGAPRAAITGAGVRVLVAHDWPGNVREVMNVMERAAACWPGRVIDEGLAERLIDGDAVRPTPRGASPRATGPVVLRRSAELASRVLDRCGGNVSEAARVLGVPRSTLRYRLRAVASGRHPTQLGLPGIAE